MPDKDPDVRVAITHSIKILSRWTIGLYLVVAIIAGGLFLRSVANQHRIENLAENNRASLCLFVADLERRMQQTKDYLDKNEKAEPIPGITRADLHRSIQNQRATLKSFEELEC